MKDAVHSLNSFFLYRYTDGKSLCTTSANVPLPKWVGPGEEMLQIIAVIEKGCPRQLTPIFFKHGTPSNTRIAQYAAMNELCINSSHI